MNDIPRYHKSMDGVRAEDGAWCLYEDAQELMNRALSLAKEATNGWACYAKRDVEHENIANLHQRIAALELEIDKP